MVCGEFWCIIYIMTPELIKKIREYKATGLPNLKIAKLLGLPLTTVRYHANEKYRMAAILRSQKYRINNPLQPKINQYAAEHPSDVDFTLEEAIVKITSNPYCYLTGTLIDFDKPDSYSLDHIIPISQGGKSNLANMGLTRKDINQAKHDKTPQEFIALCREIIEYNASG
jgi:HNH endonuclease